jgi:hypothetical protein
MGIGDTNNKESIMSENQNMEKKLATTALTTFIVLASILIAISTTGVAQLTSDANKSVDVNVSIATEVAVDVEPKTLVYTGASVGQQYNQTDRQYRGVTVENTGSEYIDQIWLNASMPNSRPFGTGRPGDYNAGNFMQVLPNMSSKDVTGANENNYLYVNRKEFKIPDSSVPSYIVAPRDQISYPGSGQTVENQGGEIHTGRFRRGDESIWFIIATTATDGGDNDCDGSSTDSTLRIGQTPATPNQLGTVDFTDDGPDGEPADFNEYQLETTQSAQYGVANRSVTLQFSDASVSYDVLTHCNERTTMDTVRTKFSPNVLDTQDLTTSGYATEFVVQAGDTATNMLLPGDTVPLKTAIEVPTGVAAGDVSQGTMTVFATANTTAQVS